MTDPTASERVPLAGSELPDPPASTEPVEADARTTVTVYLRGEDPPEGSRVTRDEWAARFGAADADVAAVEDLARANGLTVVGVDRARRTVALEGSVAALATALGTTMARSPGHGGALVHTEQIRLPPALAGVVTAVVGLDERPHARAQLRRRLPASKPGYSPVQVAEAYGFPAATDGSGQTVALIELGGGYRSADVSAYFDGLGLKTPTVTAVGVDGGANTPGSASGPDGEVMLDIEVVGAAANGARIAVYFAPNTDQGFIDAVSTAVHDTSMAPSVVSISWGGPESTWSAQSTAQMEAVFTQAAALGVTVCCASGDNGSADGVTDGLAHADFPASAPHALA